MATPTRLAPGMERNQMKGEEGELSSSFSIGTTVQFVLLHLIDLYGLSTYEAWSH